MTRRVLEKLCPDKVCVDFSRPYKYSTPFALHPDLWLGLLHLGVRLKLSCRETRSLTSSLFSLQLEEESGASATRRER